MQFPTLNEAYSIKSGGSTAPYLIKRLSVWGKTERGMVGTEGEREY